jgi:hypothetical protein
MPCRIGGQAGRIVGDEVTVVHKITAPGMTAPVS